MTRASVLIAGAGPAGSALALQLSRVGHAVSLVAPARKTHRPPETLPGTVGEHLDALGLNLELQSLPRIATPSIEVAWGDDHAVELPARSLHVDRDAFDALLLDAARRAGASITRAGVVRVERAGTWRIHLDNGKSARADLLVDATGRAARVAHALGARRIDFDRLVALVFSAARQRDHDTLLVESTWDGWWYSSPAPGADAALVHLTDLDLLKHAARSRHRIETLTPPPNLRARVSDARFQRALRASTYLVEPLAGDGWLAVGDAAFALDPLSGQGVIEALCSARAAARAIFDQNLPAYETTQRRRFDAQLRARAQTYAAERRFAASRFWRRRHGIDPWRVPITLDPETQLQSNPTAPHHHFTQRHPYDDLENLLPARELRRLSALCTPGRRAHQVIAAYQAVSPCRIVDRRVIVALESLVTRGALSVVAPTASTSELEPIASTSNVEPTT